MPCVLIDFGAHGSLEGIEVDGETLGIGIEQVLVAVDDVELYTVGAVAAVVELGSNNGKSYLLKRSFTMAGSV